MNAIASVINQLAVVVCTAGAVCQLHDHPPLGVACVVMAGINAGLAIGRMSLS